MLTKKQKDLLLFIHERMATGDIAPSFDEMREALSLKSKSGIHRLITGLVERGYLERLPHRARALEVKKLPEGYASAESGDTRASRQSREINAVLSTAVMAANMNAVPLYGRIAAGTPIEAIRDETALLDVPASLMGRGRGRHYALEIDGDSMIKAGIHNGDTVIIRETDTAQDGEIIVALVDGEEVTLKRLKREKGMIILIPENDRYEARSYTPDRVQIQGILVSLMRRYH